MPTSPLVSVCIPSYNHARYLPAALDGIFAQTFRDFEVVAVDDGSTDNSLEILNDYARKHPGMMRVYTHTGHRNLGISATDNRAIQEARGIYWCPEDSDDISYPDRLQRQVSMLESRPEIGWIYGVSDYIDQQGKPLPGQYGHDLSSCPDLVEELILHPIIAPAMIRMNLLRETGPFEPGMMRGEWEYWIRLAARAPAAFMPGAAGAHRNHASNTSLCSLQHETPERLLQDYKWSLEVFISLCRKSQRAGGQFFSPRNRALLELKRASLHLLVRDKHAARPAVEVAFRRDPSLRHDLKNLARYLKHFGSARLCLAAIQELGFPPRWLGDADFVSNLLRVGVGRILAHS